MPRTWHVCNMQTRVCTCDLLMSRLSFICCFADPKVPPPMCVQIVLSKAPFSLSPTPEKPRRRESEPPRGLSFSPSCVAPESGDSESNNCTPAVQKKRKAKLGNRTQAKYFFVKNIPGALSQAPTPILLQYEGTGCSHKQGGRQVGGFPWSLRGERVDRTRHAVM